MQSHTLRTTSIAALFLLLLFAPIAGFSATPPTAPEENDGCGNVNPASSAKLICGLYEKMIADYGALEAPFSNEARYCLKYYTTSIGTVNLLCAYNRSSAEIAQKLAALPPAGNGQAGNVNDAAKVNEEAA